MNKTGSKLLMTYVIQVFSFPIAARDANDMNLWNLHDVNVVQDINNNSMQVSDFLGTLKCSEY